VMAGKNSAELTFLFQSLSCTLRLRYLYLRAGVSSRESQDPQSFGNSQPKFRYYYDVIITPL